MHVFTGFDTVSSIADHGKSVLFDKLCAGNINEYMDISFDLQTIKNTVIRCSIAIFK